MPHSTPRCHSDPGATALPAASAPQRTNGIPLWPGLAVTALCGVTYLLIGSGGTFYFLPSAFAHHTLTANAWLHGRLYATAEEIAGQYLLNQERRAGHPLPEHPSAVACLLSYRNRVAALLRGGGVAEADIDPVIEASLDDAFHDWVRLGDRYYAYWPPLPALLLLPAVLIGGLGVSDVLVANLLGMASVAFVYLMLRALRPHWPALSAPACAALALAYGLGTCHLYQAGLGQVWALTQLSGTLFLIIAIWCGFNALQRPSWLGAAGVALGIGFLGRNTIILAAPFFIVVAWIAARDSRRRFGRYLVWAAVFGLALAAAIGAQLAFNHARFGAALDFGQGHLADEGGSPRFAGDFKQYGRFSLHYVPHNVWYYFVNPHLGPFGGRRAPVDGQQSFDPDGNSLFLVSPFMLFLFACRRRDRLLVAILAGAIPGTVALMLFHSSGWFQFGQRYLLDTMPFLLILAAFGMRGRLTPLSAALILLSLVVNGWGTYRFHVEQP